MPKSAPANSGLFHIAGTAIFCSGTEPYPSRSAFENDSHLHGAVKGSKLYRIYAGDVDESTSWPGPNGPVYRWDISPGSASQAPDTLQNQNTPAITRIEEIGRAHV